MPMAVLALAVVGVSFSSIFVRLAIAPALAIALWRLTFASAAVLPLATVAYRRAPQADARAWLTAAAAGGMLALHFASWITSLQYTSVAASVLLVNTAPVFVALLSWATGGRPSVRIWVSVALATAGAAVIAGIGISDELSTTGNLLALGGAVAMACYLLLARQAQRQLTYLSYVTTAYGTGAAVLWIAVLLSGTGWRHFPSQTWWVLITMALVSQVVGHGGYNWSLRHLRPEFVAVALTGEPVLAPLLAWKLLGEPLSAATVAGGLMVLAGIVVGARAARG